MKRHLLVRAPSLFLLLAALAGVTGCGKSGSGGKDTVSGKVTLNGQPVAGQVVFIGSDSKEYMSPIGADGNYQVIGVPKGEATILVKGIGTPAAPKAGPGKEKPPEMPGMAGGGGAAPPVKYSTAAGGLKVSVTGGEQKHDIPLNP